MQLYEEAYSVSVSECTLDQFASIIIYSAITVYCTMCSVFRCVESILLTVRWFTKERAISLYTRALYSLSKWMDTALSGMTISSS